MQVTRQKDGVEWYMHIAWPLLTMVLLGGCAAGNDRLDTQISASEVEYLIGPGDTLKIFVWRNPELSGTVTVRPDGKLTSPMVEDLPVVGKTPTRVARDIEERLGRYVRNPNVTVTVTGFVGPHYNQVRVIGQVGTPTSLPFSTGMTLLDAMLQVDGMTEYAAGNRAFLVRREDGETRRYRLRIDDLMNEGDVTANVRLMPGDVISVPEAWF